MMEKKKAYLPIWDPLRLNCDAFTPRPFLATSPKSHPSPYLRKGTDAKNHTMDTSIKEKKIGSQGKANHQLQCSAYRKKNQIIALNLHIDTWTINPILFLC